MYFVVKATNTVVVDERSNERARARDRGRQERANKIGQAAETCQVERRVAGSARASPVYQLYSFPFSLSTIWHKFNLNFIY